MINQSLLQKARYEYKPLVPELFLQELNSISIKNEEPSSSSVDNQEIKGIFPDIYGSPAVSFTQGYNPNATKPIKVGVLLSGGQAPGGHNVIAGLFDAMQRANKDSVLYGFMRGTNGLLDRDYKVLTKDVIDSYRNTGGFDMILSGRTKIEKESDFEKALDTCRTLCLDALVIIGGDDSNTNAAFLARYFKDNSYKTQVIGVPKTIDGDLRSPHVQMSFGFDTTTKTYSEEISSLSRDTASACKYWQFIKLMGRSASHVTLECALQTHPNITLISEEVERDGKSLKDIIEYICSVIVKRADKGFNYGTILIPEGIIEFIPEIKTMIKELDDILSKLDKDFSGCRTIQAKKEFLSSTLTSSSYKTLTSLPDNIIDELVSNRDPHGNIQVSSIDTEVLLSRMTESRLSELKEQGVYKGTFTSQTHFFGFEGRSAFPSNFDCNYCYSLGYTAFLLIAGGLTGYLCYINRLHLSPSKWNAGGIPLTSLMHMENRAGSYKPVIAKALVDLNGKPYRYLCDKREEWGSETCYEYTGPVQYFGPGVLCDAISETLRIENL